MNNCWERKFRCSACNKWHSVHGKQLELNGLQAKKIAKCDGVKKERLGNTLPKNNLVEKRNNQMRNRAMKIRESNGQ